MSKASKPTTYSIPRLIENLRRADQAADKYWAAAHVFDARMKAMKIPAAIRLSGYKHKDFAHVSSMNKGGWRHITTKNIEFAIDKAQNGWDCTKYLEESNRLVICYVRKPIQDAKAITTRLRSRLKVAQRFERKQAPLLEKALRLEKKAEHINGGLCMDIERQIIRSISHTPADLVAKIDLYYSDTERFGDAPKGGISLPDSIIRDARALARKAAYRGGIR